MVLVTEPRSSGKYYSLHHPSWFQVYLLFGSADTTFKTDLQTKEPADYFDHLYKIVRKKTEKDIPVDEIFFKR